jgi:hypothetical protein
VEWQYKKRQDILARQNKGFAKIILGSKNKPGRYA